MRRTLSAYANGVASYPGAEDQARYDERLESEEANVNAWSGDHQHFADEYDVDAYDCYDTYEPAPQYAPADQPLNGWEQLGDWEATSNQHATYAGPRAASPRKGRAERIAVAPKPRRGKWRILAILAVLAAAILGVATQALQSSLAAPQAGSLSYHWQRGYYLDKGWLCYGWANGAYHCTSH